MNPALLKLLYYSLHSENWLPLSIFNSTLSDWNRHTRGQPLKFSLCSTRKIAFYILQNHANKISPCVHFYLQQNCAQLCGTGISHSFSWILDTGYWSNIKPTARRSVCLVEFFKINLSLFFLETCLPRQQNILRTLFQRLLQAMLRNVSTKCVRIFRRLINITAQLHAPRVNRFRGYQLVLKRNVM